MPQTEMATEQRQVPRSAMRFAAGRVQFAAGGEKGKYPISLLARSAEPIAHWYWGNIVHDMNGFRAAHAELPIDYCHNVGEVIGYMNRFEAGNEGLRCSGELVQFQENDRVAEIVHKKNSGVPYEASIFFDDDYLLEWVAEGFAAQVNGKQVAGPCLIVRQWTLRGVAVTPYGADRHTSSEFSAGAGPGEIQVTLHVERSMSTTPQAPAPAAQQSAAPPANPVPAPATQQSAAPPANPTPAPGAQQAADPRNAFATDLNKFITRFGADNGTKWFLAGKAFDEALELHTAELQTQLAAKDKENGELKTKLAAAGTALGEATPVSQTDAQKPGGESAAKFSNLGTHLAKVAAGIKLPAAK